MHKLELWKRALHMSGGLMYLQRNNCTWSAAHCKCNKTLFFFSKVEDAFYNNELRLNGEKLWKKSRTVRLFKI